MTKEGWQVRKMSEKMVVVGRLTYKSNAGVAP